VQKGDEGTVICLAVFSFSLVTVQVLGCVMCYFKMHAGG
jgi:hypothetical protein